MKRAICVVLLLAAARADADPAIVALEHALPRGWSLLATDTELVIRHDKPVYATANAAAPLVTLELRYHLEPRWTAKQVADARATNARLDAELAALRARYKVDDRPRDPKSDDDKQRLAAYAAEAAQLRARYARVPHCALGASSVFDGPDTYAQLSLALDPAQAVTEAHAIVELVDKHCVR